MRRALVSPRAAVGPTSSPSMSRLTTRPSPDVAVEDRPVRVDPPVAEEGPVAPRLLDQLRVALRDEDLRLGARLREHAAERVADERVAEELDAVRARLRL